MTDSGSHTHQTWPHHQEIQPSTSSEKTKNSVKKSTKDSLRKFLKKRMALTAFSKAQKEKRKRKKPRKKRRYLTDSSDTGSTNSSIFSDYPSSTELPDEVLDELFGNSPQDPSK